MHAFPVQFLIWFMSAATPAGVLTAAVYYITSRPLRGEERARVLLDLIESAIAQGQPVEHYIVSLAQTRNRSLGVRLQLLAAHLEQGLSLGAALEKVPGAAPGQIVAMLKVGENLGDYRRVLPACRQALHNGLSQARALINYQVAFAFVVNPLIPLLVPFILLKLVPVFNDIRSSLKIPQPAWLAHLTHWLPTFGVLQLLAVLALYLFVVLFLGGPRFVSWVERSLLPTSDWLWLRAPWRRKRLQRDFSAMLAVLLDSQVPEEQAIKLAADCAANHAFARLAGSALESLRAGAPLPQALEVMDQTGEFRWRMENAAGRGGFFTALKGWHEWLNARAYQQEQAAAQTISTVLVLLNALTVAICALVILGSIAQIGGVSFR